MFYYAVMRNNEFVLSTVKSDDKDAYQVAQNQVLGWQTIFPDSKLRIVKLKKRASNPEKTGWELLDGGA